MPLAGGLGGVIGGSLSAKIFTTVVLAIGKLAIWTRDGRQVIPFVCGARQRRLLATHQGESDLASRDGQWYVCATCAVQTPTMQVPTGVLGVDLGGDEYRRG